MNYPNANLVRNTIKRYQSRYQQNDEALERLIDEFPLNSDYRHVILKVSCINQLYSTAIGDVSTVAKHIVTLNVDQRSELHDVSLVEDVALIPFPKKVWRLYSFATKYCSWHQPDKFPMYDGWVDQALWAYRKAFAFTRFRRRDLRDYAKFVRVVDEFALHFALGEFSRAEIDKFLWYAGNPAFDLPN